ncbi:MAG: tetratricopeptide repeat protein [Gammaproteobacteria bacterium]|nr:tetratricopeptide repeat protein [Gammaproteobacteria bacterium]
MLCAALFQWGTATAEQGGLGDIRSLTKEGQYVQALERLTKYRVDHPDDPQAHFLEGLILVKHGDSNGALKVFQAISREYPELPEPYNNLAVLYASDGRYEEARDALLEAIRTHPSYATAHENLGDIYAKMASMAYDNALALDERNRAAQAKLALVNELFSIQGDVHGGGIPMHKATGTLSEGKPQNEPDSPGGEEQVMAMLQAWIGAWSARDLDLYLSHYGENFRPQRGISRAAWESQRSRRLGTPSFIEIKIQDPEVRIKSRDSALVIFTQSYRSNIYSDRSRKLLSLIREDGSWKILREESQR